MDQLSRLIARRKRQDFLFNLLGIFCTLVGLATLSALIIDLVIDSCGLLAHYHKTYTQVPARAFTIEQDRLQLRLEGLTFTKELDESQRELLARRQPDTIELLGKELIVPLGGVDRIVIELDERQQAALTSEDSWFRKAGSVLWRFFTSFPSRRAADAGILSAAVGTLLVMLVTAATAVPLGVATGVYLEEYAQRNWLTSLIEINISNLAGVPSILYGLMALGLLVYGMNMGRSIAAAGITLAFLILPIVIVATREALRAIPQSIREAASALGATRWQVIRYHLLPYAASGISTGVIIGLSRAIGETAPLVTIGALTFIAFLPPAPVQTEPPFVSGQWLQSPFTVLPIQMFNWVSRPGTDFRANAAMAGLVLIVFTLGLNAIAIVLRYRLRRQIKW